MGDLIHTLPALTDARRAFPDIQFDWACEPGFTAIPSWHFAVNKVIPVALRRWRQSIKQSLKQCEIQNSYKQIRAQEYDVVIDAQGLLKSAIITLCTQGIHYGMDWSSCRESVASLFYQKKIAVAKDLHAIVRVRQLFAQALAYPLNVQTLDYGLSRKILLAQNNSLACPTQPYLVFLYATSALRKYWRYEQWLALAKLAAKAGLAVYLPWGNTYEYKYAQTLAANAENITVLPQMRLVEIGALLAKAVAVVGVDTGLSHLAAAINLPAVTLYITTSPLLTGACGINQTCLSEQASKSKSSSVAGLNAYFHSQITADIVWKELMIKI